jgi:hypothetical protein
VKAVQVKNQAKTRKWAVGFLVLASLAWTVYRWDSFGSLKHRLGLHQALTLGIAVAVSEICFIGGAVILTFCVGRAVFSGTGFNPLSWFRHLLNIRAGWKDAAKQIQHTRAAYWGLYMNWLGALGTTGVIPILAIALLLPIQSWGLMAPFILDVVATCSVRQPLLRRLRAGGVTA